MRGRKFVKINQIFQNNDEENINLFFVISYCFKKYLKN